MDERTDEDLLAAYTAGDEEAFSLLVKRHIDGVYSFIYRLVGSQTAAEDITQETFLKIWKNIGTYSVTASRFKTWMLKIARNASIDFLRKRKSIALSQFDDEEGYNSVADSLVDEGKLPHELFAEAEDVQMLEKVVAKLSPKHREILALHYTNHLTFEEIAETLGEPHNTVKSRHHRALLTLRKLIHPTDAPNNT